MITFLMIAELIMQLGIFQNSFQKVANKFHVAWQGNAKPAFDHDYYAK